MCVENEKEPAQILSQLKLLEKGQIFEQDVIDRSVCILERTDSLSSPTPSPVLAQQRSLQVLHRYNSKSLVERPACAPDTALSLPSPTPSPVLAEQHSLQHNFLHRYNSKSLLIEEQNVACSVCSPTPSEMSVTSQPELTARTQCARTGPVFTPSPVVAVQRQMLHKATSLPLQSTADPVPSPTPSPVIAEQLQQLYKASSQPVLKTRYSTQPIALSSSGAFKAKRPSALLSRQFLLKKKATFVADTAEIAAVSKGATFTVSSPPSTPSPLHHILEKIQTYTCPSLAVSGACSLNRVERPTPSPVFAEQRLLHNKTFVTSQHLQHTSPTSISNKTFVVESVMVEPVYSISTTSPLPHLLEQLQTFLAEIVEQSGVYSRACSLSPELVSQSSSMYRVLMEM